jgi:predicted transposase/invertase (TIGR01784 family)
MSEYLNNPHDHFFKELLAQPEHVTAFLEAFLPPAVLARLDVAQPEPVKDSFVDEALRDQHSDLLFRVPREEGDAAYVYILFEHKSAPDDWVAWQLLRYLVQLWTLLLRNGAAKLPPVFPLVVYHGERPWQTACEFSALFEQLEADSPWRAFQPEFRYHLCDLSAYDATRIQGAAFLQAGLRLMQTIFTDEFEEALGEVLDLMLRVKERSTMEYLRKLLRYSAGTRRNLSRERLKQIVDDSFAKAKEDAVMSTVAQEWIEEGRQAGRQEGRQEGWQEGIQQARLVDAQQIAERALTLLEIRFGKPEPALEQRVRALTFEQVADLMVAAYHLADPTALFRWLDQQERDTSSNAVDLLN